MLYISLLLIASGVFLTIFSIIKNSEEGLSPSVDRDIPDYDYLSAKSVPSGTSFAKAEAVLTENADGNQSTRREPGVYNNTVKNKLHQIDRNSSAAEPKSEVSSSVSGLGPKEYDAVLYEDSSNLIDYNDRNIIIDTENNAYKNLCRIGKGKVSIKGNGINFDIGKKFFHFDFHRIEDIKNGKNYKAIFLKGSKIVRLFIFEQDVQFPDEVELLAKT